MLITCKLPKFDESYLIEIGFQSTLRQVSFLQSFESKLAIISDDQVASYYGKKLKETLLNSKFDVELFTFPHGEINKNRSIKEALEDQLLQAGYSRDSLIIALGGGVVSDLAGFLAATYCRGVPFIIFPTTLLGMVDASIGGKTGVNVPKGKNRIGCIYQPKKVVIDVAFLKTLPKKEMACGAIEMIKHALIADSSFFDFLKEKKNQILNIDVPIIEQAIFKSCEIKVSITQEDEKEKGKRSLLNVGHTIGHALEAVSNYEILHGEAVAMGILIESFMAKEAFILNEKDFQKIEEIIQGYFSDLCFPPNVTIEQVISAIIYDKKTLKNTPRFSLIRSIGIPYIKNELFCSPIDESIIRKALNWFKNK